MKTQTIRCLIFIFFSVKGLIWVNNKLHFPFKFIITLIILLLFNFKGEKNLELKNKIA